jgi:hypothetical protein
MPILAHRATEQENGSGLGTATTLALFITPFTNREGVYNNFCFQKYRQSANFYFVTVNSIFTYFGNIFINVTNDATLEV